MPAVIVGSAVPRRKHCGAVGRKAARRCIVMVMVMIMVMIMVSKYCFSFLLLLVVVVYFHCCGESG